MISIQKIGYGHKNGQKIFFLRPSQKMRKLSSLSHHSIIKDCIYHGKVPLQGIVDRHLCEVHVLPFWLHFLYFQFLKIEICGNMRKSTLPKLTNLFTSKNLSLRNFSSKKQRPIFVAATKQHVGKTSTSLALLSGLQKRFDKVGFIKPVGELNASII